MPAPISSLLARRFTGLILSPRAANLLAYSYLVDGEYEELQERFGIDYKRVKDAYPEMHHISNFFAGGTFVARDMPNEQILDWKGLRGRLRSSSFAPTEGHPNYAPMMAELERIFRAHERDGRVLMEYWTRLYFGQLRAGRD